jgi:hypothetical protein
MVGLASEDKLGHMHVDEVDHPLVHGLRVALERPCPSLVRLQSPLGKVKDEEIYIAAILSVELELLKESFLLHCRFYSGAQGITTVLENGILANQVKIPRVQTPDIFVIISTILLVSYQ